jgi:cryptochrome
VNKLKIQWVSWFLSNPFRIIDKNNGKAPLTYHQFQAIIASMEPPPKPQATITEDHDERYGVPTLDELGFDTEGLKTPVWIGGETEALGEFEIAELTVVAEF